MAGATTFLELVLPELAEFTNAWHTPLNQNFEDIDDWLSDLYESLVGSSATSVWVALRGTLGSLSDRLAVSINPDGTIDLTASPDILALSSSVVYDTQASPRARFDLSDLETYSARSPVYGDRFSITPTTRGDLDVGMAHRLKDYGIAAANPVGSPPRHPVQGMVSGNAALLSGLGEGQVVFNGVAIGSVATWPVFNIDGHLFRVRESVVLDYTGLPGLAAGNRIYFYVERRDYNNAAFEYRGSTDIDANLTAKDLRQLQSGADGVIGAGDTVFTSASALFNSKLLGKVLPGDILVITAGAAAGSYPIESVDSDTQVTVIGKLKATSLSGLSWYVSDPWHPNIGAVKVAAPGDAPPFQAGRAYFGTALHVISGSPFPISTFAPGGVYDSGWIPTPVFPYTTDHNIGVLPSSVEIWVRAIATPNEIYPPLVRRAVMVDFSAANITVENADGVFAELLVPSMSQKVTPTAITVRLLNAQTQAGSPQTGSATRPAAVFTTDADVDVLAAAAAMRIIVRR